MLLLILSALLLQALPARAQTPAEFTGQWMLDRDRSEFPREVGFDIVGTPPPGAGGTDSTASGGRRGRRGAAGPTRSNAPFALPESEDDAKRLRQLTDEVRNPPTNLTVTDSATALTIAADDGTARTFRVNGQQNVIQLEGVPVGVTARRTPAGQVLVVFDAGQGRELHYTYSLSTTAPPELVVVVQFFEPAAGQQIRRVYVPGHAAAPVVAAAKPPVGPGAPGYASPAQAPAAPAPDLRPGADLKGLTKLGVVVEGLNAQAAACGLSQPALEAAVTKRVTDAGFQLLKNSDEDTYVYVNVMTTSPSAGLCISRYDVFLYTHTTAQLSYQQQRPVLVTVSLIHKGGLSGGAPSTHGSDVVRGVQEYVDQMTAEIHDANK